MKKKQCLLLISLLAILILIVIACLLDSNRDYFAHNEYPQKYTTYVEAAATEFNLPSHLIYAVIHTESRFDSGAVSAVGAIGLMQLMPDTFRWLSDSLAHEKLDDGMIYDPQTNIRYGCRYLRWLYNRYGDITAALAAYNAGPGRVDAWLKDPSLTDEDGKLIADRIPLQEPRRYVDTVLSTAQKYYELYSPNKP
jgi:soluble lytic murein transglycosylase